MYRFLDRPVLTLSPGEQSLIWSMRSWVAAMVAGRCPCQLLEPLFTQWRLADILPDFNGVMVLLNREGQGGFRFCAQTCGQVNDDEARLLVLFHAAAAQDNLLLRRLTDPMLKADAVPPFLAAIGQAADMLRRTPVPRAS